MKDITLGVIAVIGAVVAGWFFGVLPRKPDEPIPPVPIEVKMYDLELRQTKALERLVELMEAKDRVEPSAMRLPDVQRGLEVLTSAETIDLGKIKLGGDSKQ